MDSISRIITEAMIDCVSWDLEETRKAISVCTDSDKKAELRMRLARLIHISSQYHAVLALGIAKGEM